MTLVLDAGALYVQANRADPLHDAVVRTIDAEPGALITSEAAAQEADYLIGSRLGLDAELAFLTDLASGAFEVACLDLAARAEVERVARRYRDLRLGLADATLVVLAGRYRTTRVASVNLHHLRAVEPLHGDFLTILPVDES